MYLFPKCYIVFIILWTQAKITHLQRRCPLQDAILPCRCLVRKEEYQIWCSHSDLPNVLDGLRAVSEYINDPIDELIIENNFLPSLPARMFYPLKVLRLMLRHNALERVPSDWLAGLQSTLVEIFIVEPQLRSLPEDSLLQINALQAITIQTALLKRLPTFSGLENLRYVQIESEALVELSPTNFKNNPKLEKLLISASTELTRLEANLFFDLPNLNILNISACSISWLHPRTMTGLPLLKELWLVGNKITDASMIGRAIRDLPQLEILRLDNNFINRLSEGTFVDLPVLRKIYLSGNKITELNQSAFHMVPQLKILDLNKNNLRRIHPESFLQHSGSGLEELYLVENEISQVAELRSLLDALPKLIFLDMRYNKLEAIPFGTLRGHPTLEYINLDYNNLLLVEREAFMAMPALRELRLRNNSLSDSLDTPLWNLPELKGLDLSGNFLKLLRPNFFQNLPSLRRIDLSSNGLTLINPELFLPTPSLEHINISHNHIKTMHPATFRHLLNLYELDVSFNHLLEFIPGVPRGIEYLQLHHNKIAELPVLPTPDLDLPSLRMIDLSFNKIQLIPKSSLGTMPQLRKLYIGNNFLQSITENALTGLNRLETLYLSGNVITHIHPNAFKDTARLQEINLSNNHLDILIPDLFKDVSLLKKINLSKNQLAEIFPGTFDKNLELEDFDASYNVLVKLPVTFYGLKNLRYLDLTSNRIKNIDPEIVGSLVNLKELKLSENFIQDIKQGSFSNLHHLKKIYLDSNEIEFIESNAIKDLPVLKTVKLNKNFIKEIPNTAFTNLSSLQVVELQENKLQTIAPSAFNLVPHLLMLNLSNNNLIDLENAGLSSLKSLEMLDVSNNRINKVISPSLEKMEWLVELRMDNNEICSVQELNFNTMPRLRVLNLKNNKMTSFPEQAVHQLRGNIAVLDVDGNPLICDCNILWLQAWLRESAQIGPHCLDGTLLREISLSREECSQKTHAAEVIGPGCQSEFLSAPVHTAQVFSKWMKLKSFKNATKENTNNKNNIAPSPEESEYFYDEYIDYPYNESMIGDAGFFKEKNKNNEEQIKYVTSQKLSTTKSPHYTPGDTPTIYAAPKNQSKKPNVPSKVSNSPSTSGFTFFGVPLSNLNLNNLLSRGSGRMDTKLPPSTSAQRKTAIINKHDLGTGRSSSIPSNLPLKMQPPYMQPPNLPEIQTGFVPLLPSYGGFKPIPNPNLSIKNPTRNINSTLVIATSTQLTNGVSTASPKHSFLSSGTTTAAPLLSLNATEINTVNSSIAENSTNCTQIKSENIISITHTYYESSTTEGFIETAFVVAPEITTTIQEETTLIPKTEEAVAQTVNNKTIQKNSATTEFISIITTDQPDIITTSNPKYIATVEIVKNTSSNTFRTMHVNEQYEELSLERNFGTPSSTLLIPSSNPPQFKHGGRSTITKVNSPHMENPLLQSSYIQTTKNVQDPLPHNRENKNMYEYFSHPGSKEVDNSDRNWYFANYNKTNLEPYVAQITNTNKARRKFQINQLFSLVLVVLYVDIVAQHIM